MKKIITLLIVFAALLSGSVKAENYDLDVASWICIWEGTGTTSTDDNGYVTWTTAADYEALGIQNWSGTFTGYTGVYVEIGDVTFAGTDEESEWIQLFVQYSGGTNLKAEDYSGNTTLSVAISSDSTVTQICVQNKTAGDVIVLKSAYLSADEVEVGETLELDLSEMYLWSGSFDSLTLTATYNAQWDGCGIWLGGADWSDYQYLTVEWDAETVGSSVTSIWLIVEGYESSSQTTKGSITTGYLTPSVGIATLTLTEDVWNYVTQYYVQTDLGEDESVYGTETATVTFTKAYLWNKSTDNAIVIVSSDDAEVVSTTYYSLTGVASKEPTKGINIVRQLLSDGTYKTTKILVK